jgi:hypothetical protein
MPSMMTQRLATEPAIMPTVVNSKCAQIPALAEAIIAGTFKAQNANVSLRASFLFSWAHSSSLAN